MHHQILMSHAAKTRWRTALADHDYDSCGHLYALKCIHKGLCIGATLLVPYATWYEKGDVECVGEVCGKLI